MTKKMLLNVIHRAEAGEVKLNALKFQQDTARAYGLKTTIILTSTAMRDMDVVEYARQELLAGQTELGIGLVDFLNTEIKELTGSGEYLFYMLSRENKRRLLDLLFERFETLFGFQPEVIGCYILDAWTLRFIKDQYPRIKIAVTNCFEEGVKMFHGNNNWWYLFNDGGPWGAYYPSRDNQLIPARDQEDWVGIVGVPHLNRDMALALTGRDDYFASHPHNLMRAKVNIGPESPYQYDFIDQWVKQTEHNQEVYFNTYVGLQWMTPGNFLIESLDDAWEMYRRWLAYLGKLVAEGKIETLFMGEFADHYKKNVAIGTADINIWDEKVCGSKRQTFWYVDPHFRVAIDMNTGGSICDLRAYDGHLNLDVGPDTKALWNGNYPFLISTEHRALPEHTCEVIWNKQEQSLTSRRIKAKPTRYEDGTVRLDIDPVDLTFDGLFVSVATSYFFPGDGTIQITRKIVDISDPTAVVQFRERHYGCQGTTQYPEDMRDIELSLIDGKGALQYVKRFAYDGSSKATLGGGSARVSVPSVGVTVALTSKMPESEVAVHDTFLFRPFYTLTVLKTVQLKEEFSTCLQFSPL